jgi:hypothetical protein
MKYSVRIYGKLPCSRSKQDKCTISANSELGKRFYFNHLLMVAAENEQLRCDTQAHIYGRKHLLGDMPAIAQGTPHTSRSRAINRRPQTAAWMRRRVRRVRVRRICLRAAQDGSKVFT